MADRIDHAAEAQRIRSGARQILMDAREEMQPHMVAVIMLDDARLEATLAVAEQLRVANLIRLDEMEIASLYRPGNEIKEALNLD